MSSAGLGIDTQFVAEKVCRQLAPEKIARIAYRVVMFHERKGPLGSAFVASTTELGKSTV